MEEADRYCSPHRIHPDFRWLINYARPQNVSLICLARRASNLHRDLTANADWIVAHQTIASVDLEYLSGYMDISRLPRLRQFQWEMWGHTRLSFADGRTGSTRNMGRDVTCSESNSQMQGAARQLPS